MTGVRAKTFSKPHAGKILQCYKFLLVSGGSEKSMVYIKSHLSPVEPLLAGRLTATKSVLFLHSEAAWHE
jgi:hypothetical protein